MKNLKNYTKKELVNILTLNTGCYYLGENLISKEELSTFSKIKITELVTRLNPSELEIMEAVNNNKLTDILINEGETLCERWHKNQFPGISIMKYKEVEYAVYYGGSDYYCSTNEEEINRVKN